MKRASFCIFKFCLQADGVGYINNNMYLYTETWNLVCGLPVCVPMCCLGGMHAYLAVGESGEVDSEVQRL
jgi:hypothetical protein